MGDDIRDAHDPQGSPATTHLPVLRHPPAGAIPTSSSDTAQPTGGFTELVLQRQEEADSRVPEAPAADTGEPVVARQPLLGGHRRRRAATTPSPALGPGQGLDPDPQAPAGWTLPTGRDLDELAEHLYGPISARLRAELWVDRERSGLLVELRR